MMIERTKVDGRDATVVYLTDKFVPIDKAAADFVKIIFDDGSSPIFGEYVGRTTNVSTVLHVYEFKKVKMAQIVINGAAYQIAVTPQISAMKAGDYKVELSNG